jgi:lipopolysaccharide export system permease protein
MSLHRYILSQIFWPILLTFFSLNLLFLIVQLLKMGELAFGANLALGTLLEISLLFLPGFCVFTIPIAVLTGVLLGFGRMAADREVIAFLGAGISSTRLAVAPAILGIIAALVAVGVASRVAPASNLALKQIVAELTRRHIVASLEAGRFYEDIPHVVLYPRQMEPGDTEWNGFLMFDCRSQGFCHSLTAQRAEISPRSDRNALTLLLKNGELHGEAMPGGAYSLARFANGIISMDIEWLVSARTRFIPDVEQMSLKELARGAIDQRLTQRDRNILSAAWHRRFAFPLASVLFALLGTALTASGKLRGSRGTLVTAVLMITLYYLMMRFGDALIGTGVLRPAFAAWLPDLLVGTIAGLKLTSLARRPA